MKAVPIAVTQCVLAVKVNSVNNLTCTCMSASHTAIMPPSTMQTALLTAFRRCSSEAWLRSIGHTTALKHVSVCASATQAPPQLQQRNNAGSDTRGVIQLVLQLLLLAHTYTAVGC